MIDMCFVALNVKNTLEGKIKLSENLKLTFWMKDLCILYINMRTDMHSS